MTTKEVFECRKMSALKRSRIRMVRQIAYEIYLSRINEGHPGDAYSDWMQAERELEKLTGDPSDLARSKAMVRKEHLH